VRLTLGKEAPDLSEQTIISNLSGIESDFEWLSTYVDRPEDGVAFQFRLFSASVVSRVSIKMRKYDSPTSILTAYIRESNGVFGSGDFVPGSNIATSTNAVNADDLDFETENVEFTFSDVELAAGTYCIAVMAVDEAFGNGAIVMPIMESGGSSQLGAPAWWSYYDQIWYSWNED
jgi:hypothetical protein